MLSRYTGIPGRYVEAILREEMDRALRDGLAAEMEADPVREQDRRAALVEEMGRAEAGGCAADCVALLSPGALAAAPPSGAGLARLARWLGIVAA